MEGVLVTDPVYLEVCRTYDDALAVVGRACERSCTPVQPALSP